MCCEVGTFLPGDTVTMQGLQQRADLNGRVALVEFLASGEGDAASWRVQLGGSEGSLSVKAANLRRHPRATPAAPPSASSA